MKAGLREEGPMLEARMCEQFTKCGWECNKTHSVIRVSPNRQFRPDISLSKDGRVYGFVECYLGDLNPRKQEQILFILDQYKPELFILTNGINYEVYFNSKYAGTMTVPIGYNEYERLIKYAKALGGMIDGKDVE